VAREVGGSAGLRGMKLLDPKPKLFQPLADGWPGARWATTPSDRIHDGVNG